ncbi:tetratricopeptide repeat protein [Antribacter soli]|nr:tetratricopeptide repeat protein [Antribacter soli]
MKWVRWLLIVVCVLAGAIAITVAAIAGNRVDGGWREWVGSGDFWISVTAAAVAIGAGIAQSRVDGGATLPPVGPPVRLAVTNAPLLTAAFTGRAEDLAWLHEVVGGSKPGVAVVHGLGGVGKSSLVVKYLTDHQVRGRPVWWIRSDSPQTLEQDLAQAARRLHLGPEDAAPHRFAEEAIAWLVGKGDFVVVLDNVNRVQDVEPVLRALRAARNARVVVTTRLAAGWSLAGMVVRELGVLSVAEAVRVLTAMAGPDPVRAWPGAVELVEELGRLPLAVDQAGAYLKEVPHLTPADFRDQLRRAPQSAITSGGFGSDGERTIARIWRVTLDRLAQTHPEALDVLRVIAWWSPDGIPVPLLDGLDGATSGLQALAGLSMVTLTPDSAVVHRLVQTVARTPDPADPHRQPEDIADALQRAALMLADAMPDVDDPGQWSQVRLLLPSVEAYARHTEPGVANDVFSGVIDRAATFLQNQGALGQATGWFERALAAREQLHGVDHPDTLTSRNNLASAYLSAGDLGRAIPLFEQTLADNERVLGADHPNTLTSRNNLAGAYASAGDLGRAIPLYERTLSDRERVLGADHPHTLTSRNSLAGAYESAGDLGRAIPLYEATLADQERVLGVDHPDTLTSRNNLAGAYESSGDLGRAIPLYEATLADCERVLGVDHPNTLSSRNNLAYAYQSAGDLGRAIPVYEATLADRERVLGADHPDTLTSRNNLAYAYGSAGERARAIPVYEATLADRERVLGADHPDTLSSRNNLATTHASAGHLGRAIPLYEATLADRERVLGVNHPDTLFSRENLALAYSGAGRHREAVALAVLNRLESARLYGADDRRTLDRIDTDALVRLAAGDRAAAVAVLEDLLPRCERALGPDDALTSMVRNRLAEAHDA